MLGGRHGRRMGVAVGRRDGKARQTGKERKGRYIMNDTVFEFSFLLLLLFVGGLDTGGTLFL